MHIKDMTANPAKLNRFYISILVLITLLLGIYLIGTTVIISKDGVTFINYAWNFETNPSKTIIEQDQHPGYPFSIWLIHKVVGLVSGGGSIYTWIHAAQISALLFRILAVISLYYLCRKLLGRRKAFFSVLILSTLPRLAHYGSDTLSDWPHFFFMITAVLMLVYSFKSLRLRFYILAGIFSGLGYLFRPESIQVVIYAVAWTILGLFFASIRRSYKRAVLGLLLLLACFTATASPYMFMKGAMFPKKKIGSLKQTFSDSCEKEQEFAMATFCPVMKVDFKKVYVEPADKLLNNIGETVMWYYLPFMIIGLFYYFRNFRERAFLRLQILSVIIFNILLMIWLYNRAGYMSIRHSMPLSTLMVLFTPLGFDKAAELIAKKKSADKSQKTQRTTFFVLLVTGLVVCGPKLLRPINIDKKFYLTVSNWLKENTETDAVLGVPDPRIGYYTQKQYVVLFRYKIPETSDYYLLETKKDENKEQKIKRLKKYFTLVNSMQTDEREFDLFKR